MEGFSLHFTYFVRDTKRKHLFLKGKNKHWKNLLVLIMWKKNKTKQENPFSGVVRIVSTPHFTPSFSWFLCIALHWALPCPFLWANSGLFIVLLYNELFITLGKQNRCIKWRPNALPQTHGRLKEFELKPAGNTGGHAGMGPRESFYDRASLQTYRRPQNTCCVPTAMEASRVAIHWEGLLTKGLEVSGNLEDFFFPFHCKWFFASLSKPVKCWPVLTCIVRLWTVKWLLSSDTGFFLCLGICNHTDTIKIDGSRSQHNWKHVCRSVLQTIKSKH